MAIRAVKIIAERTVAIVIQIGIVAEDRIGVAQNMFIHVVVPLQNIVVAV